MADKVYLHIGLPKTGTTSIQGVMWPQRDLMRAQGVLLPGQGHRDHIWANRIVRGVVDPTRIPERWQGAWDRLVSDTAAWPGTAVISHEFFVGSSPEHAARIVADLAPAEVHVVVTAREPLGLMLSGWQQSLKNRYKWTFEEFASQPVSEAADAIWNWRSLDLSLVLERWVSAVPAERIHIITLPGRDEPREALWQRFATLVGLQPDAFELGAIESNTSMGVVEAETLRRINFHLETPDFHKAFDRGVYLRTYLGESLLVPRGGERFWPPPEVIADCRRRGEATVAAIRSGGYDVIGDLDSLLVPEHLPERRRVDSVTDAEVAEVAVAVIGQMMHDYRNLRNERNRLRDQLQARRSPVRSLLSRVRSRLR